MHFGNVKPNNTVWWTWTAPEAGVVSIDTLGHVSNADNTALAVYTGDDIAELKPVMQKQGRTEDYKMAFSVQAGRKYQIVAGGASGYQGQMGFNLHFHATVPVPVRRPVKPAPKPVRHTP